MLLFVIICFLVCIIAVVYDLIVNISTILFGILVIMMFFTGPVLMFKGIDYVLDESPAAALLCFPAGVEFMLIPYFTTSLLQYAEDSFDIDFSMALLYSLISGLIHLTVWVGAIYYLADGDEPFPYTRVFINVLLIIWLAAFPLGSVHFAVSQHMNTTRYEYSETADYTALCDAEMVEPVYIPFFTLTKTWKVEEGAELFLYCRQDRGRPEIRDDGCYYYRVTDGRHTGYIRASCVTGAGAAVTDLATE